jgi:hypothetical protein
MNDFDWKHVEAFPSVLRLLYDLPLRAGAARQPAPPRTR